MIGTANSGKSTLYNSLLNSDYCNHHVRDIVPQATVSELPGNYEINGSCIEIEVLLRSREKRHYRGKDCGFSFTRAKQVLFVKISSFHFVSKDKGIHKVHYTQLYTVYTG